MDAYEQVMAAAVDEAAGAAVQFIDDALDKLDKRVSALEERISSEAAEDDDDDITVSSWHDYESQLDDAVTVQALLERFSAAERLDRMSSVSTLRELVREAYPPDPDALDAADAGAWSPRPFELAAGCTCSQVRRNGDRGNGYHTAIPPVIHEHGCPAPRDYQYGVDVAQLENLRRSVSMLSGEALSEYLGWLEAEGTLDTREVTPAVTSRVCECGCGQPLTSPRPEAKYATGACRVRALRQRRTEPA